MINQSVANTQNLYDQDFYLWTQTIVQHLKENNLHQIDIPNLIEEIESIGKIEKRELKSCLIMLLMHLLKWQYQPEKRSESWRSTITEQRICIEVLIVEKIKSSFLLKLKSKQLLEIAKIGVEKAIETDEVTATNWINQQLEILGIDINNGGEIKN
jgi:hypothetical protein